MGSSQTVTHTRSAALYLVSSPGYLWFSWGGYHPLIMCASCCQGDIVIVTYVSPNTYALEDWCCHLNIILVHKRTFAKHQRLWKEKHECWSTTDYSHYTPLFFRNAFDINVAPNDGGLVVDAANLIHWLRWIWICYTACLLNNAKITHFNPRCAFTHTYE